MSSIATGYVRLFRDPGVDDTIGSILVISVGLSSSGH